AVNITHCSRNVKILLVEVNSMNNQELKAKLYTIIFGTDTPAGKRFDLLLIIAILLSVLLLMAESMPSLAAQYMIYLRVFEWVFTVMFSVEYAVRIYCSPQRWR